MRTLPGLTPSSWVHERLPEMLWAALLVSELPRPAALAAFRRVGSFVQSLASDDPPHDITHTGLLNTDSRRANGVIAAICEDAASIEPLRAMLVFEALPRRELWLAALGDVHPDPWLVLTRAVARSLWHQSEEATDCRWVRVLCLLLGDRLRLPTRDLAEEILGYPSVGDLRKVRPSVRAMEIGMAGCGETATPWSRLFWAACLRETPCTFGPESDPSGSVPPVAVTLPKLRELQSSLLLHAAATRATSGVDPRHDSAFGIALYSLALLGECLSLGNGQAIAGRLILRALLESWITLAELSRLDAPPSWSAFRVYGAGQAKLSSLKLAEAERHPLFVSADALDGLANDDMWEEFLDIDIGHWANSNLRSLSVSTGLKTEYDLYYPWTSSYTHGNWAAIRDVVFRPCGNPLHRLHRVPRSDARTLPDAVPDAARIATAVLDLLAHLYPWPGIAPSLQ